MQRPVKQSAKAQKSRATRRKIIDAARLLFETDGYLSTTIAAIAKQAGVATQTVYFVFGNKISILEAILDTAITGDDEPVPVLDRDWVVDLRTVRSPSQAATLLARQAGGIVVRAAPIYRAILRASAEPEIEALLLENKRRRGESIGGFADALVESGLVTESQRQRFADLLYAFISEESYMLLVHDRDWSQDEWFEWLEEAIRMELDANASS